MILDYINQVTAEKAAIEARQADAATSIEQDNANKRIIEEKGTMIDVLNSFYTTCASHPRFDARTGGCKEMSSLNCSLWRT